SDGSINLRWINLHFGLMHLLPALFAYAFGRELGRSRFASVFLGIAFAGGGYVGAIGWPQMLHGAIWLPATLLFFHRFVRLGWTPQGIASAVLCGGSIGMSLLSGHHQTPYFALLALGGLFLWTLSEQRSQAPRLAALLGVAALAAFLVSALQLFPAFDYGREAYRWVNAPDPVGYEVDVPYNIHVTNRLYPITLMGLVIPRAFFQVDMIVGWVCLTLALYAVVALWSERWVRVYACLAVGMLAFGFGPFTPLHGWVYDFLPWGDKARSPSHSVYVFQLALYLLAAFGADRLLGRRREDGFAQDWLRWSQRALVGFGALTWITLYWYIPQGKMESEPGDQMAIASLTAWGLAAVLEAWKRGRLERAPTQFALLAMLLVELHAGQFFDISDVDDPKRQRFLGRYAEMQPALQYLRGELERRPGDPFRFELVSEGDGLNVGAWYGVEQVDGFLASVSSDLYDFLRETDWLRGRMILNTAFTIAKAPQRDDQQLAFEDPASEWRVYRNPAAGPRAWVQHGLEHVENGAPAVEACEDGSIARFTRPSVNEAVVEANAGCRGYLIVAEPWAEAWQAEIDGKPVRVFRYRNALRAVEIPAGASRVRFVYRPAPFYWGAALTALGLMACIGAGVVLWRRPSHEAQASR
ncbi:MAG: YfhO family protein, partial [Acidobacteria bacterium]|nr:YfhO family protein [Acidobacteriota bacterium]